MASTYCSGKLRDRAPSDDGRKRATGKSVSVTLVAKQSVREACTVSKIKYRADFVPQNTCAWQEVIAYARRNGKPRAPFARERVTSECSDGNF